jgi:hypothetical protein
MHDKSLDDLKSPSHLGWIIISGFLYWSKNSNNLLGDFGSFFLFLFAFRVKVVGWLVDG